MSLLFSSPITSQISFFYTNRVCPGKTQPVEHGARCYRCEVIVFGCCGCCVSDSAACSLQCSVSSAAVLTAHQSLLRMTMSPDSTGLLLAFTLKAISGVLSYISRTGESYLYTTGMLMFVHLHCVSSAKIRLICLLLFYLGLSVNRITRKFRINFH